MIIRNVTAILAAIFLVTVSAKANEFCGERYCGQFETVKIQKHYNKKHYSQNHRQVRIVNVSHSYGSLINKAESYLGTNPTGWRHVWCGRFMAMIAPEQASRIRNPNLARDWATLPGAHKGQGSPGDIVVLSRGRGGHVGVLKGYDGRGNPIIISGNHGRSVGVGAYPAYRVIAVVPG